jgi:DNA-binding XRE family transcriptional regulator
VALPGKELPLTGDPTGDELRFLRKRMGKSSKDFAQLVGVTSEQYSRIEGATLTASNDKLFRLMVMAMSVLGALKEPALMESIANQTWDTGIGWSGGSSPMSTQRARGLWGLKLHRPGEPHISESRYWAPAL